jgi:hypothetical protein
MTICRDALMSGALLLSALVPASAQEPAPAAGTLTVAPTGYIQFDMRAFPGWDATPGTGRLNRATAEIRRASVGVEASWRRLSFEVSVDPRDDDGIFVKDAYAQFRVHRALRIRVGQFKIPGTREYDGSARRLDFLERSPLTESLAVRRDIGARADGRRGPIEYEFGLFAGDGVGRDERAGLTVAGRLAWQLNRDLQIGASVSDGRTEAVESDDPNGLQGRSPSGYRFLDGVYVQGQRVRVGGDLSGHPGPGASSGRRFRFATSVWSRDLITNTCRQSLAQEPACRRGVGSPRVSRERSVTTISGSTTPGTGVWPRVSAHGPPIFARAQATH